ncbi:hypothetical protein D3C86_1815370 [compost metagenome]
MGDGAGATVCSFRLRTKPSGSAGQPSPPEAGYQTLVSITPLARVRTRRLPCVSYVLLTVSLRLRLGLLSNDQLVLTFLGNWQSLGCLSNSTFGVREYVVSTVLTLLF